MLINNRGRKVILAGIILVAIASAASAMGVHPDRTAQAESTVIRTQAPKTYILQRVGGNREVEIYEHSLADNTQCVTTVYPGYGVSTTCAWNTNK